MYILLRKKLFYFVEVLKAVSCFEVSLCGKMIPNKKILAQLYCMQYCTSTGTENSEFHRLTGTAVRTDGRPV